MEVPFEELGWYDPWLKKQMWLKQMSNSNNQLENLSTEKLNEPLEVQLNLF